MKCMWINSEQWFLLRVTADTQLQFAFKIFIVIMYWQTQTADASVCSGILGWKESSVFPSRKEKFNWRILEKILSGKLCVLQLQKQRSSASHCFCSGLFSSVCVFIRHCEGCVRKKAAGSQVVRSVKTQFHKINKRTCPVSSTAVPKWEHWCSQCVLFLQF